MHSKVTVFHLADLQFMTRFMFELLHAEPEVCLKEKGDVGVRMMKP